MTTPSLEPSHQSDDQPMPQRRNRTLRLGALLFLGALVVSACGDDKPLNTFEPSGPQARTIHNLMYPWVWGIMGFVFVAVLVAAVFLALKNRVKEEDYHHDDLPYQRHGHNALEIGWTILPAIVLAVVAVPTVIAIWDLETRNEPGELDVMVLGHQWWWEYRYDVNDNGFFRDANNNGELFGVDGEGGDVLDREWPLELALDPHDLTVSNELVIPAGVQVDLLITSRDVIHSFWIPRLNGKRDAVPGRYTTWILHADEPGKYTGWCTEFCGLSHARMRMSIVALPQDQFDQWLANQLVPAEVPTEGTPEFEGRELFRAQCASCHVIREDNLEDFGVYKGPEVAVDYVNPFTMTQEEYEAVYSADQRATLGETADQVGWASTHTLTARNAPDLTKFASRSVYAGSIYSQYVGLNASADDLLDQYPNYINLSNDATWNEPGLRRWIRNAPGEKAMSEEDGRGMPAFPGLSNTDIDNLVAYLATLD